MYWPINKTASKDVLTDQQTAFNDVLTDQQTVLKNNNLYKQVLIF